MLSLLQNMPVISLSSRDGLYLTDTSTDCSRIQTWNFTVELLSGHLDGEAFFGQFSYDSSLLSGVGVETLSPTSLVFSFCGIQFQATDDVHYPLRPSIKFVDGVPVGLDYQVWIQRCFGIHQGSFWYEGGRGSVSYTNVRA